MDPLQNKSVGGNNRITHFDAMAILEFNKYCTTVNSFDLGRGERANLEKAARSTKKWTERAYVSPRGETMMAHTTACNQYLGTLTLPITQLPMGRLVRKNGGVLTFVFARREQEKEREAQDEETREERSDNTREERREDQREEAGEEAQGEAHEEREEEAQEDRTNEGDGSNNEEEEQQQDQQNNHEAENEEYATPTYERTQYDTLPNLEPLHPNNNGGVPLRPKATTEEIIKDPFAVVDHISFNQCYGTAGASFDECERVPWACREMWAEFYGEVCNQAIIATEYDHLMSTNQVEYNLFMERRMKMFFLAPTLIFRKLNDTGTKIHHVVRRRLTDWRSNHLEKMIDNFEADLVKINSEGYVQSQSGSSEQLQLVKKVTELVQLGQMKKARQLLLSTGCSDPNEPHITEQMRQKFPARKEEIAEPTEEQFSHP
jgi:hypothetical protein